MDVKVDSLNGIDQTGSLIFKTLDYALDYIVSSTDSIINIELLEGNYTLKLHDTLFKSNKTVNIKGKNHKTTLTQTQGFYSNESGGSNLFTLNIYNLIYNMSNASYPPNWNYFKFNWNFYNVVFDKVSSNGYGVFLSDKSILTINNCVKVNTSINFLRTDYGKIYVKNSYGGFTNGYSTIQSSWDIENNIIINTPKLDSKYKITDGYDNNLYGVYSGIYSWRNVKYILKNNNHYYASDSKYYSNNQYNLIPELEGKTTLTKLEYDNYGFEGLETLTQNITVGTETFRPIDKLQKQFDSIELLRMEVK